MTYLLIFSIILNIALVCYVIFLLKKLLFVSDNINDLMEALNSFSEHISAIYNLETFYGEPILEKLVLHSKDVLESIREHHEAYSLSNIKEQEDDEEEEEE